MVSSRRIPKGPGRRPKSLARRQFMELIARGWPLATAARQVGVSRSVAYLWRDGATVRDKNGSVRHVAPLEPLALKPISPRFLSEEERIRIADLASRGVGVAAIGVMVGRSASTISRELRRNRHGSGQYRPFHAHRQAALRRRRPKPIKLETNEALREYVSSRLSKKWSPQQISRSLKATQPGEPGMYVAPESIYMAIYRRIPRVVVKQERSPLRTGRDHRRAHSRVSRAGRRFAQPMLTIHERGFDPGDRTDPGHWEGDLIVGPHNRSAIGALAERKTRYLRLVHLEAFTAAATYESLVRALGQVPATLRKSLTWDQGREMAKHLEITEATGTQIYFCDRASPWQRGTNENTNGLLRQYFPKSTDLSKYSSEDLERVEEELNERPRMTLGDRTPAELFAQLLSSHQQR